jgi:hypothetical protein
MFFKFSFTALALMACASALALNQGLLFHRNSLLMQSSSQTNHALKLRGDGSLRTQVTAFFDQKLDHANNSSPTFKQRYFVDSVYAQGPDSPVMFIICGEWNCGGTGSYSFVEGLAKKHRAHLVALEHRFYGESLPTRRLTPEALRFLNLSLAITDLAVFQRFMMDKKGLKGKWIAVGGSYAGTLAAFYREKHPELVTGSLASSGPVFMKNAFKEYDAHIAKVINKSTCGDKVRAAVQAIEAKIATPDGASELKKLFNSTNIKDDGDFLYVVADMLAAAVQYGRDRVFCSILESKSDLIQGYAAAGLSVLSAMGTTPFEISLAVAEKVEVSSQDNMRQWMWQSCQEFGWFQVANGQGKETSRSSRIDLPYHNEVCKRLYGKSMGRDGALNARWYFPLFTPQTSRIIFSNGSKDPWLTLSVTESSSESNREFDLFMMEGAAHCDDLNLGRILSVSNAQMEIDRVIGTWLK